MTAMLACTLILFLTHCIPPPRELGQPHTYQYTDFYTKSKEDCQEILYRRKAAVLIKTGCGMLLQHTWSTTMRVCLNFALQVHEKHAHLN
jgi:hypothetical protein